MTLEPEQRAFLEVSIRRDFGYAVSHCVIPFVFDVKFAEMTA